MPSRSEPSIVTVQLLRDWPLPEVAGAKDSRGTALIVGGSRHTPGAVLLAGVAALRAGAGVLQLAVEESTATALSIQVPEALVLDLPEPGGDRGFPDRLAELAGQATAVAIGPGLGDIDHAADLLRHVLDATGPDTTVVLDAYALGALSKDPSLTADRPGSYVLTPNVGEARYLLGGDVGEDLMDAAVRIAQRYRAVVSLFGRIADPDGRTWWEQTGGSGLGTSGSGDVRAGVVTGLLSRGAEPAQAACWAAYAHAGSAQRLAPRFGRIGFLAREIADEIPAVLASV
ncbi:ADP-dependent (S)-NAD(P)H-hydrate dehydratase [Catellatospora methionotrophica]|uniref:ADP-dependent (S)-NAD(P)H-hydrate dehydratase n=1 Tax=Catellatospora methionotrophica TaxID=121620 RepID=A0A8J3PBX5_9ACTN|nr:NAD(P)H-hydrate dehydratase [Catellatospora methionotrophica]GIG11836.1 ADP-dependent (S)-NAD(P)H-hydrate dehydratase [Catellatospora methionotrophica]